MPGFQSKGYEHKSYRANPECCQRCGGRQFVTVSEPGCRTEYCAVCAEVHHRDFDPVDRRCEDCKIIKKMDRSQWVCDDCVQRSEQARVAWALYMGRTPR